MKILAFDHVQLAMLEHSAEKVREFYINLLGFYEIRKPTELAKRGGVWFQCETVQLHIGIEKDFRPAKKAHPAFLVDNLDDFISRAKSFGIEIDSSQPELEGFRRIHISDPFGNRIVRKKLNNKGEVITSPLFYENACIPVCALPKIRAWTSCVPS